VSRQNHDAFNRNLFNYLAMVTREYTFTHLSSDFRFKCPSNAGQSLIFEQDNRVYAQHLGARQRATRLTAEFQCDEFLVVQRGYGLAAKAADQGAASPEKEADEYR
jgi:hypothetical protein